jgi:hypothetical protein
MSMTFAVTSLLSDLLQWLVYNKFDNNDVTSKLLANLTSGRTSHHPGPGEAGRVKAGVG